MQFITLDTVDDPRVEAYVSLTEMQLRNRLEPAKGVFIAESPKVIDRALASTGAGARIFPSTWPHLSSSSV